VKLAELFEQHEEPHYLTQSEFDALPSPSPQNIEDRFRVGDIAFDATKGLGNVPLNSNVDYMGFTAFMSPKTFLELAAPADRKEDAEKIEKLIRDHAPLGTPFLLADFNDEEYEQGEPLRFKIVGHEGRGRMNAVAAVNGMDSMVPVNVFPRGIRARNLSEKFFHDLKQTGIIPQTESKDSTPKRVNLGKIFWMKKVV
jgi:hypothetical protein